jgi:hypothetical protein
MDPYKKIVTLIQRIATAIASESDCSEVEAARED